MEERSQADAAGLQNTVKGVRAELADICGNRAENIADAVKGIGLADGLMAEYTGTGGRAVMKNPAKPKITIDPGIAENSLSIMSPDITKIPRFMDSGVSYIFGITDHDIIEFLGSTDSDIIESHGLADFGIIESPGPIDSDIIEIPGFADPNATNPPDNTDSDIVELPRFTYPDITDIPGIKDLDTADPPGVKDPDTADPPGVKDPDTADPPGIIDSDPTDIGSGEKPSESGEADSETEEEPTVSEDEDASAGDTPKDDTSEDAAGLELIEGFEVDAEGYITGCTDQVVIIDDILLLPSSIRCAGIRKGALDSVGSTVMEVYIPANICDIEKGVFDSFLSLMFFEVSEENPYYYSLDGILYAASKEVIAYPAGR